MKKLLLIASSLAMGVALSSPLLAADAASGKTKATACAACHGQDGKAMIPTYPNLAGQNAAYIVEALKAYKAKTRTGGQAVIMQSMAAPLSEADMADLAAYFSSLGK